MGQKLAYIEVSYQLLHDALHLPEDVKIRFVDGNYDKAKVLLEGEPLPADIAESERAPLLIPQITVTQSDNGQQSWSWNWSA